MRTSLASLLSLCSFSLVSLTYAHAQSDGASEAGDTTENYKIEGKVTPPDNPAPDWLSVTSVTLDGGKRRAFLRDDHSFVFQVCMSHSHIDHCQQNNNILVTSLCSRVWLLEAIL